MDTDGIGQEAVNHFSRLFSVDPVSEFQLLHVIPNLSADIDNVGLEAAPSIEEVKKVIFEMDGDSAVELPRFITATSIVLLPKVLNPKDFSQFRPISIWAGGAGGNLALKLDMVKAYDRVSWRFLIAVLRRFGFGEGFIDMVWKLISNVWFSEVLSRGLESLVFQSEFVGYKVPRHCLSVTHLAFADDVIIFANGGAASLKRIMQILAWYQNDSGQLVNVQKSGYLVHPLTTVARKGVIERITKFRKHDFPVRYLGGPVFVGRAKEAYFSDLCNKILDKVLSWKSRLLSYGGKIVLIKLVLSSIPTHLLAMSVMPKRIFRHLCDGRCNFWYDNWIGHGALYLRVEVRGDVSFSNVLADGDWVTWRLAEILPIDMVQQVLAVAGPCGNSPDWMIWTATSSGKFSLSSAYNEIRETKPPSLLFRQAWHAQLPLKVSFFMLRLLRNRLPLDDVLVTRWFQLASKCSCCWLSNVKSLRHLLLEGDLAVAVWRFFGPTCGLAPIAGHVRGWMGS
nr:uncharacterized protein LOC113693192 [Coffea arabica]